MTASMRMIPRSTRARQFGVIILAGWCALVGVNLVAPTTPAFAGIGSGFQANVNPWVGTGNGGPTHGEINTFPGPSMPYGMMQWGPDNFGNNGYSSESTRGMRGFSLTHASGVGCETFGDIPILPTLSEIKTDPGKTVEKFDHKNETAFVGNYGVSLDSGIGVSLTGSTRAGLGQFSFPANGAPKILFKVGGAGEAAFPYSAGSLGGTSDANVNIVGTDTITGSATGKGFCGKSNKYTVYFAAKVNVPFTSSGVWNDGALVAGSKTITGANSGGYVGFGSSKAARTVTMKVAISFQSIAQATKNLTEISGWDPAPVIAAQQSAWNTKLGTVAVSGGTAEHTVVFYTALYHSLLAPNTFSDLDGSYLGTDGARHEAKFTKSGAKRVQYTNISDWDTYRSLAPLQAWLDPVMASDLGQSLVNDADQSGSFSKWKLANASTGVMTGDSVTPLIANLYAWGATDFDTTGALKYMLKGAEDPTTSQTNHLQRQGLSDYLKLGYVPVDNPEGEAIRMGASQTLEYAVDDFSISQFAAALKNTVVAEEYLIRSDNWRNVFNSAAEVTVDGNSFTGQVQARDSNGAFSDDPKFRKPAESDILGSNGFDEGSPQQYTWMVPQNSAGLIVAMGGNEKVITRLNDFFTKLNEGAQSPYFWAGNEPGFQVPWTYHYAAAPGKSETVIRRIQNELFTNGPDGEPGNDDLGAQSAWYVWSAIGLYPAQPGLANVLVNTPLFPKITINHWRSKLVIASPTAVNSDATQYIQTMKVNGIATTKSWLSSSLVQSTFGSTVAYTVASAESSSWGRSASDLPPSTGAAKNSTGGFGTARKGTNYGTSISAGRTLVAGDYLSSNTGATFILQADGNLVFYGADREVIWAAHTAGRPGAFAVLNDTCNFAVYDSMSATSESVSQRLWQTSTKAAVCSLKFNADSNGVNLVGPLGSILKVIAAKPAS